MKALFWPRSRQVNSINLPIPYRPVSQEALQFVTEKKNYEVYLPKIFKTISAKKLFKKICKVIYLPI